MNASAISAMKSIPLMMFLGTRCRQNGPNSMPATMYAVTFGSLSFFVMRVMRKPQMSISAMDMMICDTADVIFSFS